MVYMRSGGKTCKNCKETKSLKSHGCCGPACKAEYNARLKALRASWRDEKGKYIPGHGLGQLRGAESLYERDGYLCYYCGGHLHSFSMSGASLDHVYPKSLGGPSTASNLVTACKTCNNKKQAKIDLDKINEILKDVESRNSAFNIPTNRKIDV